MSNRSKAKIYVQGAEANKQGGAPSKMRIFFFGEGGAMAASLRDLGSREGGPRVDLG